MSDGTQKQSIPRIIEPRKFAHHGVALTGDIPALDMPRLAEVASVKVVNVDLCFSLGERKERLLTGSVSASTQMQCQRCLKPVNVDISCDVSLAIVWNEEKAKELPGCYEPWIVEEDEADLYGILEEELLLNVPLVASHKERCVDEALLAKSPANAEVGETDKLNPFQVLQQLKDTTKK